jgi:hypothetical protein
MIRRLRAILARRRLQRLVERTRASYTIRQFRERREAAKRGWQRRMTQPKRT